VKAGAALNRPRCRVLGMAGPLLRGKQMAAHHVIWKELHRGWSFLSAHRHGRLAARMKPTPLGWIDKARHHARNPLNFRLLPVGQAVEQFLGVGV
jgi:hypothetical protein